MQIKALVGKGVEQAARICISEDQGNEMDDENCSVVHQLVVPTLEKECREAPESEDRKFGTAAKVNLANVKKPGRVIKEWASTYKFLVQSTM